MNLFSFKKSRLGLILFTILVVLTLFAPNMSGVLAQGPASPGAAPAAAAPAAPPAAPVPPPSGGTLPSTVVAKASGCTWWRVDCLLVTAIGRLILRITSFIMWLCASILSYVLNFTVVNFKYNLDQISGIKIGWAVFRDIANIFFIFILLYIAIATILRIETINTKKTLSTLIVVALLLNFSLFFTKLVIDSSNIMSLVFYNKITVNGAPVAADPNRNVADGFISSMEFGPILAGANSPGFLSNGPPNQLLVTDDTYPSTFLIMLFIGIMFTVLAFVFLTAGLMLLYRFIVLVFLLLLSPLAFAGLILPKTKGMIADKWWKSLIDQCLFAPVFFMLLWVVLVIIQDPNFVKVPQGSGLSGLFDGTSSAPMIVMRFMLVVGLAIGTLIVSKSLGASGASGALAVGGKLATSARKGAQGYLGRGALRASGIAGGAAWVEDKLKDTRFGEFAPIRGLRKVTTGAVLNTKFGSKQSINDVNKADSERAEKIALKEGEAIKKLPENKKVLQQHREARNADLLKTRLEAGAEKAKLLKDKQTKDAELNTARAALTQAQKVQGPSAQAKIAAAKQALATKEAEVKKVNDDLQTQDKTINAAQKAELENSTRMNVYQTSGGKRSEGATDEEKTAIVDRARRTKLDQLQGLERTIDPTTKKPFASAEEANKAGFASKTQTGKDKTKQSKTDKWTAKKSSADLALAIRLKKEMKGEDPDVGAAFEKFLKGQIKLNTPPPPPTTP
jgi:hypothetical protein